MLRSLFTLCTLSGVILLSGCKETKSEAWYKQHPDETYVVYTQCLKDGEASDNCEFAHRAALMFAQEASPGLRRNSRRYFSRKLKNEMQ